MQKLKLIEQYISNTLTLEDVLLQISVDEEIELLKNISQSFNIFEKERNDLSFFSKRFLVDDEVAIFPGSFQPWHQGHEECLKQCPYKNIIVMPDRNPQKTLGVERAIETYLKLLKHSEVRKHFLYPEFLLLSDSNPTYFWLKKLQFKKKILLVGDDSFMTILSWIKGADLVMELDVIVVLPRFFQLSDYKEHEKRLLNLRPKLEIKYLDDHPFKQLSSRSIRSGL